MLFVFLDDATLDVLENIEEARSRYESIDVESGDCVFYDANGNYLKPTFPVPNKKRQIIWHFSMGFIGDI